MSLYDFWGDRISMQLNADAAGQADKSVLDKIVPGYYQRLDLAGGVENSTCCSNIATVGLP